jgi:hypothetical protein
VDGGAICNGACVDVTSDPGNCGACGQVCGSNYTCGFGFQTTFDTTPAQWIFLGSPNSPYISLQDGSVILTNDGMSQASTVLYANLLTAPNFQITLHFRMTPPNSSGLYGDGMGLALLSPSNTTFVGEAGKGLGMTNLIGTGIEFDVYANGCDPDGNHVAIDTLNDCASDFSPASYAWTLGLDQIATLADGSTHGAQIGLTDGVFSVSLDGTPLQFYQGAITNQTTDTPYDGGVPLLSDAGVSAPGQAFYLALMAATGSYLLRSEIYDVSVTFPTPTCF